VGYCTLCGDNIYNIYTYYLLTPWSRDLLEKLIGLQLVKKFPAIYIYIYIYIYILNCNIIRSLRIMYHIWEYYILYGDNGDNASYMGIMNNIFRIEIISSVIRELFYAV